jgi:hypothetical protein
MGTRIDDLEKSMNELMQQAQVAEETRNSNTNSQQK